MVMSAEAAEASVAAARPEAMNFMGELSYLGEGNKKRNTIGRGAVLSHFLRD
jgi:hypothetical protein